MEGEPDRCPGGAAAATAQYYFKKRCTLRTISRPDCSGGAGQFLAAFDLFEVGEHRFDCGEQVFIGLQALMEVTHKGEVDAALVDARGRILCEHVLQGSGDRVTDDGQGRIVLQAFDAGHEHLPQLFADAAADDSIRRGPKGEVEDEGDVAGIRLCGSLIPGLRFTCVIHVDSFRSRRAGRLQQWLFSEAARMWARLKLPAGRDGAPRPPIRSVQAGAGPFTMGKAGRGIIPGPGACHRFF